MVAGGGESSGLMVRMLVCAQMALQLVTALLSWCPSSRRVGFEVLRCYISCHNPTALVTHLSQTTLLSLTGLKANLLTQMMAHLRFLEVRTRVLKPLISHLSPLDKVTRSLTPKGTRCETQRILTSSTEFPAPRWACQGPRLSGGPLWLLKSSVPFVCIQLSFPGVQRERKPCWPLPLL